MDGDQKPASSTEPDGYSVLTPNSQIELQDRDFGEHDEDGIEDGEDEEVLDEEEHYQLSFFFSFRRSLVKYTLLPPLLTLRNSVICRGDKVKLSVPRPLFVISSTNEFTGISSAMQARMVQSSFPKQRVINSPHESYV